MIFISRSALSLIILMLSPLAGCGGKIDVRVDIANPADVFANAESSNTRAQCFALASQTDAGIQAEVSPAIDDVINAAREFRTAAAQALAMAALSGSERAAEKIRSIPIDRDEIIATFGVEKHLHNLYLLRDNLAARRDTCASPDEKVKELMRQRRMLVSEFRDQLREPIHDLEKQARDQLAKLASNSTAPSTNASAVAGLEITKAAAAAASAAARCRDVTCGGGLGESTYAFSVASLNEELWTKQFNYAYARGINGNVDIVIKLNSQADFTVKGMRFDASKIAEVARKATTQALLIATQIAGIPPTRPLSAEAKDSKTLYGAGQDLAGTLQKQDQRAALMAARRTTLKGLAISIASSEDDLGTAAGRASLKAAIDARFAASDALLRLSDYPK